MPVPAGTSTGAAAGAGAVDAAGAGAVDAGAGAVEAAVLFFRAKGIFAGWTRKEPGDLVVEGRRKQEELS